jgi:hypothetical protein
MPNAAEPSTPPAGNPLQAEIDRLTETDKSLDRKRFFAGLVRQNANRWEQRLRDSPIAAKWLILEAWLARLDVQYQDDLGSLFYDAAKRELGEILDRLVALSDPAWIPHCSRRMVLLRRLRPLKTQELWDAYPARQTSSYRAQAAHMERTRLPK